jgi:murein L,D-transpeptidase YcbB/YkuD
MKTRTFYNSQILYIFCVLFLCVLGWSFKTAPGEAMVKCSEEHWKTCLEPSMKMGRTFLGEVPNLWKSYLKKALAIKGIQEPNRSTIVSAYQRRVWKPIFVDPHFEISQDAQKLLQRLETLMDDGIDPSPYRLDTLYQDIQSLDRLQAEAHSPKVLCEKLWAKTPKSKKFENCGSPEEFFFFLEHAKSLSSSQPLALALIQEIRKNYRKLFQIASRVDVQLATNMVQFAREMNPYSYGITFEALLGKRPMSEILKDLEPSSPRYEPLRQAFKTYLDLAFQTNQTFLHFKRSLRKGEKGELVRSLQERLKQEGLYEGEVDGSFNDATHEAIREFQSRHLLQPDGVVGRQTIDRLNVTFEEKARMIAYSMNLMRQSETNRLDRYIRINIPQFMLEYYNEGKLKSVHRVIVGKPSRLNQTPSFMSAVERLIFNPNWYISERIRLELGNKLDSRRYFTMSSSYSWGGPRIAQRPGPTNPLGRVKFEFPNSYAIYVHDTPKKHLFKRTRRTFSHGCVRLENAVDLAQTLLIDEQNPVADEVKTYVSRRRQVYVNLNQPVPIILEYVPVSTDENERIVFCGDPYKRSRKALKKMPGILFTSPENKGYPRFKKTSDA